MIKRFEQFGGINENYNFTNRDFGGEIVKITKDVEEHLISALEYCMENDIFKREDLSRDEYWYEFPSSPVINLDCSNDGFAVSNYLPAGSKSGNYIIPKGGYLFGSLDNNNEHEMDVTDLDVWGMIELLKSVESWIDDYLNG